MEVHEQPMEDIVASVDYVLLEIGTREEISEMLQQQINVHCISVNGETVLHPILRNEKLVQKEVVEFLTLCLARGVDPNIQSTSEKTVLHLAVERRMKGAVSCLLERAADLHVVDERGNGIGHCFIEDEGGKMEMAMIIKKPEKLEMMKNCSRDFTQFLLDVGVKFDRRNANGKSASDLAIIYNLSHLLHVLPERTNVKNDEESSIEKCLPATSSRSSSRAGRISFCDSKCHCISRRIVSNAIKAKTMCLLDFLRELAKISVDFELTNGENPFNMIVEAIDCKDKSSSELQKDLVEFFTCCLAPGVDPNIQSEHGETASRMEKAVNCLLECAAGIDVVDQSGNGIAYFFIEHEYEKLKMAMSCPLTSTPENREISENCSRNIASFLLDIGVDFDHMNEEGKSALHLAMTHNMQYLLPVLLERVNIKDYKKLIKNLLSDIPSSSSCHSKYDSILLLLLHKALTGHNYDRRIVFTVLKEKREMSGIKRIIYDCLFRTDNMNMATNFFENLTSTCEWWKDSAKNYFSWVLKNLIARGVNINEVLVRKRLVRAAINRKDVWLLGFLQEVGMTLVGLELKSGENLIDTIVEPKTQMDYKDKWSSEFHQKFVDLMVRSGYDFNSQDQYGNTALQTAIDCGNVSMVRTIIESGADLNRPDKCGRTAFHHALMIGKQDDLMIKPPTRQFQLTRPGRPRCAASTYLVHFDRWYHEASTIVELLMKAGVEVNIRDLMLNTPLHIAVFRDNVKIMELLLERNVDVNAKDKEGDTPLQLILILREQLEYSFDMMEVLLKKGACPNVRNMHMETPLKLALIFDTRMAEELLRYNADVNDASIRQMLRELHDDELGEELRRHYTKVGTLLCMQRHWMKLMAANLPLCSEYRNYMANRIDEIYYEQCLAEIEELKKVLIDDEQSLYDFLHMHPRRRCSNLQRGNLQQIVESSNLMEKFPKMSVLVMASYQEAKVFQKRETISVVVSEIFSKMYNVSYQEVADKIVGFLREEDMLF